MKKALVIANLAGFASFLLSDFRTLSEMGYTVDFAANGSVLEWSDTANALKDLNVRFIQIDFETKNPFAMQNLRAFRQLNRLISSGMYDLIHCHTPIPGIFVRALAMVHKAKHAKIIYTTHGFTFTRKSSKKSWILYHTLEDFFSRFCDAIVTINSEDYEVVRKMRCKRVFMIHGVGVNTKLYGNCQVDRYAYRKELGIADKDVMVLSVGELSDRKNHRIIIDALALLPSKDKYVYVICGNGIDGGTGDSLIAAARERNVRLKLLGFRHDIPEITMCSDIGAIPSVREGLGLAGIQSLAAGVPLVGTDVQGIRDYIIDGETGYLCDAFDAVAFAEGIEELTYRSTVEVERMRKKCQDVAAGYDKALAIKEMKEIYRQVLSGSHSC